MSRKKTGRATGRGAGGGVTSKGDTAYVSVYCVGSKEHPHDKWRIGTLLPAIHDEEIVWQPSTTGYYDPAVDYVMHIARPVRQWLVGDKWVSPRKGEHDPDVFYSEGFRVRWSLLCATCGLRRTIASPSDFYPVLTALAAAGVAEVELLHFVHSDTPLTGEAPTGT